MEQIVNLLRSFVSPLQGSAEPQIQENTVTSDGMYTRDQVSEGANGAQTIRGNVSSTGSTSASDFAPTVSAYRGTAGIIQPQFLIDAATNASGDYKDTELLTRLEDTIKQFNFERNNPLAGSAADPNYVPGYINQYNLDTSNPGHITVSKVEDSRPLGENAAVQSSTLRPGEVSSDGNATMLTNGDVTTTQPETSADAVEYTYKPGDTFGQVLLDLGLSKPGQLWGPNGDVDYYTRQLRDQDMLDARGNVKLGKKFKLIRRR